MNILDSLIELLIKGIPESLMFVLAVNIFTGTKLGWKKYLTLSSILILVTYITRLWPISLVTHTMLILLTLILLYVFSDKVDLQKIIKIIISVIAMAIILAVSELLDYLLLSAIFDGVKAKELLNMSSALIRSVSALPSIFIFAIAVFLVQFIMNKIDKNKKVTDGADSENTGEQHF